MIKMNNPTFWIATFLHFKVDIYNVIKNLKRIAMQFDLRDLILYIAQKKQMVYKKNMRLFCF